MPFVGNKFEYKIRRFSRKKALCERISQSISGVENQENLNNKTSLNLDFIVHVLGAFRHFFGNKTLISLLTKPLDYFL